MIYIYLSILESDEEKHYFEDIYINYKQKMFGIAYSILHNVQDSEDAVHQAFLKMADNFQKILSIPRQELPSYIVIIIRNTSINIIIKIRKQQNARQNYRKIKPQLILTSLKISIMNNWYQSYHIFPINIRIFSFFTTLTIFHAKKFLKCLISL